MTPFQEWLEAELLKWDSVRAFAKKGDMDDSTVNSWRLRAILPNVDHERKLAAASGKALEEIQALVDRTRRLQQEELFEKRRVRKLARAGERSSDSSGWGHHRLPLARAGHPGDLPIPAGADRLRRMAPAH